MKTTVVFDMGGVLTGSLDKFIDDWADSLEEAAFFRSHLLKSVEWVMLDRGTITEEALVKVFCDRYPELGKEKIESFVYDFLMDQDTPNDMLELIKELKANGVKLYLMSNVGVGYPRYQKRLSSLACLDGHWCSYHHKLIKPEPEAFQSLFRMFDLKPEECFFIDDAPANIEQSINQGMDGFLYRGDIKALRKALKEKGYPVNE